MAAGCRFYSAYPMTPASGILTWMADHAERCGVVVKQMEDELAVANVAIGAGYAGARAMCATSGGGFALMTEAIGMAGMIEAPVVFVEVQRGGPSTGIPTKTEQADLNQVYGASAGRFPAHHHRAHETPRDCFDSRRRSLQPRRQIPVPVIIISDLQLSEHPETVDPEFLTADVPIDRGEIVTEWNGQTTASSSATSSPSPAFRRARFPAPPNTHVHRRHRRTRRRRHPDQRRLLQSRPSAARLPRSA